MDTTEQYKIIRLPRVMELTALSRSAIYERIASNNFPKQINLGGRAVGWSERQVCDWIEQRMNKVMRDAGILIEERIAQ